MTERGVQNVAMVWQSATYCDGNYSGYASEAWYLGDGYVDWVGLSYFTQTDCDLEPLTALVDYARERGKPVMIAEATPQRYAIENLTFSTSGRTFEERTPEQIWDEWYAPFFDFVSTNRDRIRAVAYINAHWDAQSMWGSPYSNGYWGDLRVQANPLIRERWLAEVTSESGFK